MSVFDHPSARGTFAYFCQVHGSDGGVGMSGTIVVQAAAAPTDTPVAPNEHGRRNEYGCGRRDGHAWGVGDSGREQYANPGGDEHSRRVCGDSAGEHCDSDTRCRGSLLLPPSCRARARAAAVRSMPPCVSRSS